MFKWFEKKQINTQAKRDLEKKLKLERTFNPEIKSLFSKMNRDFKTRVAATGLPPNATNYQSNWENALVKHYERVQKAFMGVVDVKSFTHIETKQETEALLLALLEWSENRSIIQSLFITNTNQANMNDAIEQARASLQEQGLPTDNNSIAQAASKILKRKTNGRASGIETLETQAPAESTKLFDARIQAGVLPTDTGPVPEVRKTWRTIGDKLVRTSPFSHKAANFQKVGLNQSFTVGGQQLNYPGDNSLGASIANTINCLHPDSVIDFASPTHITRRFYNGKMVTIKTASGKDLTVTPNHPILSVDGWVAAKDINNRTRIVGTILSKNRTLAPKLNINNTNPTVEKIFNSFGVERVVVGMGTCAMNFHGDVSDHDVDIVRANRKLLNSFEAFRSDPFRKFILPCPDFLSGSVFANSLIGKYFFRDRSTSCSNVGIMNMFFDFFRCHFRHSLVHGFGSISRFYSRNFKYFMYSRSARIQFASNGLDRFSRLKELDNWIKKKAVSPAKRNLDRGNLIPPMVPKYGIKSALGKARFFFNNWRRNKIIVQPDSVLSVVSHNYSGFVYNLEDDKSYYICNGVVNHNCRCSAVYRRD